MDVIVTGATGGIGRCLVKLGLESGKVERIYCQYRNEEKFQTLFGSCSDKLVPEKQDARFLRQDSCIMQKLYKNQPQDLACIFTMFHIQPIKRIGTYTLEEIKENLYINVLDLVLFTNWLISYQKGWNTRLKLIYIDSGAAYKPLEGWGMYCASKAYANMFLKTVQLENPNVKVVSYEPGVVDTRMQEEIRKTEKEVFGQVDLFREYYRKKMLNSPEKVAEDLWNRFVEGWDGTGFQEGYKRE